LLVTIKMGCHRVDRRAVSCACSATEQLVVELVVELDDELDDELVVGITAV